MSLGVSVFLTFAAGFGVFATLSGQWLTAFASGVMLLGVGVLYVWNRNALARFTVTRTISAEKVPCGRPVYYEIEMANRKLLPLFWLHISDRVPEQAQFVQDRFIAKVLSSSQAYFSDVLNLGWYEVVRRRYRFVPTRRGLYEFGPGRVSSAGVFGLFEPSRPQSLPGTELLVFPPVLPIEELGLTHRQLFGARPHSGWMHKDPLNIVGVRPYQSGDQRAAVNWKASARHGQLEVNVEKPSFDQEIHVFLAGSDPSQTWEIHRVQRTEAAITAAASVVEQACRRRQPVGFYTNLSVKKTLSRSGVILRPGNIQGQRQRIFTAMALLHDFALTSMIQVLAAEKRRLPAGARVVVIGEQPAAPLAAVLAQWARTFNLLYLQLGPGAEGIRGVDRVLLDEEVFAVEQLESSVG